MALYIGHAVNPLGVRTGLIVVAAETREEAITKATMRLEAHAWSTNVPVELIGFSARAAEVLDATLGPVDGGVFIAFDFQGWCRGAVSDAERTAVHAEAESAAARGRGDEGATTQLKATADFARGTAVVASRDAAFRDECRLCAYVGDEVPEDRAG